MFQFLADLFFSSRSLIDRPLNLDVGPVCLPSEIIVQKVLLVSEADKRKVLLTLLERDPGEQFLIFVSSKDKADFLAGFLFLSNISVAASKFLRNNF